MSDDDATFEDAADGESEDGEAERSNLVAEVAAHDESLAADVAELEERADRLAAERDDLREETDELTERLQRTQADFQNYKKRAERKREQVEERATEDLVTRLLDVRDNLARALEHDEEEGEDVRDGVEATLRAFDETLAEEGVERIEPEPGAAVDPERHEVMMTVESDQPADAVAEVYRPGYEMAGKVLRPAQVTVSDGSGERDDGDAGDGGGGDASDGGNGTGDDRGGTADGDAGIGEGAN